MDYGKIKPPRGWTKESGICPKCGRELEDLSGVAISVAQYRREVGKCFLFDGGKTIECQRDSLKNWVRSKRSKGPEKP